MFSTAFAASCLHAQPQGAAAPELNAHDAAVLVALLDYEPRSYCLKVLGQSPDERLIARLRESGKTADLCATSLASIDIVELSESASGELVILLRYRCGVRCGGETRYKLSVAAGGTVSVVSRREELEF